MSKGGVLTEAIEGLVGTNNNLFNRPSAKSKVKGRNNRELELALAVLLVDLASVDQNFDMREYNTIAAGLARIFGTNLHEVQSLVNQANLVLKNLRGTSRFAELLRDNLSVEERQDVMKIIDEVISADGIEDGFETYLRHKFSDLLQVKIEPLNLEKKS